MYNFTIKLFILFIMAFAFLGLSAQEEAKSTYAYNTFEGTRVVVGHSVELLKEGELDFIISHRFGPVNSGLNELFGLDNAIMRLGLDYAINNKINIGIGRSSQDKILDGFIKVGLIRQQKGAKNIPFSITALATMSAKLVDDQQDISFQNRLAYTYQFMIARKFNDRLSIQIVPSIVHYNLVDTRNLSNDVLFIGAAAKYQINKALSMKAEYFYAFPDQLAIDRVNSLAIGFDIDTGGHIFQLHMSNSGGLVESAFLGDTRAKWTDGHIQFGFTISRVFRLKGRRY